MSCLSTAGTRGRQMVVKNPNPDLSHSDPLVWLVTGYRAGERAQIMALADALGWPYEVKDLVHRRYAFRTNLLRGRDLRGIDRRKSSPLAPPWPDLIISAGMRNEPVCRWIRDQANGSVRIVHIGRPWARPDNFDLVVSTPQYRLPEHPVVLQNTTTLHRVTASHLEKAARTWAPRLADLPEPRTAVILGGNSGPYTFGSRAAARLAQEASRMANRSGGSLLVTTSARTPLSSWKAFKESLDAPAHCYDWAPDPDTNPYYGYLALAESIIVTCDSISMLSEACATRKPVYMFDLLAPRGTTSDLARESAGPEEDFRLGAWLYRLMMRYGPRRLSRDVSLVHERLISSGHAVWLGETFPDAGPPALSDVDHAVQRVHALFPGRE